MANTRQEAFTKNIFFRDYFQQIILFLMIAIGSLIFIVAFILFQITHRPSPVFSAVSSNGKSMSIKAYDEPNLRPEVILTWASKAATAAYNFGFSNYKQKIQDLRQNFTDSGWASFNAGIDPVVQRVIQNQLIVQGVVSGTPVISNQGDLPGAGYTWRVQIPFLVTYLSADNSQTFRYFILMNIIKVPTNQNPQGIGINTFEMR